MANWISMADAAALPRPGARVYLGGATAEPTALLDAVDPGQWRDVILTGSFLPGINDRDYRQFGRVETIMLTAGLRGQSNAAQVAQLPLSYTGYRRYLQERGRVEIAYFQVSPPENGSVSLGLAVDFAPTVARSGARLIGIVNPLMPVPKDGIALPIDLFEALVDHPAPLAEYDAGQTDRTLAEIGRTVAGLIEDGDTVELGIGRLQVAVLNALQDHRRLAFHAGMIAGPIAPLLANGTFDQGVTTGVATGDRAFYDLAAAHDHVRFRDVETTHGIRSLSQIPNFVAVNSAIEIDLFGQTNAETMGGRPFAGQGGLPDFVRGARASHGGRSIIALPATAKNGTVSRIRPAFPGGIPITISRAEAELFVTEYGVADLRGATVEQRAERLIGVAAPQFRNYLSEAWEKIQAGYKMGDG
ncbi:MAG: acetyl-CoA hydrolase/transferase C-terminal domain-containing protein [Pseudomonadota bacterium]